MYSSLPAVPLGHCWAQRGPPAAGQGCGHMRASGIPLQALARVACIYSYSFLSQLVRTGSRPFLVSSQAPDAAHTPAASGGGDGACQPTLQHAGCSSLHLAQTSTRPRPSGAAGHTPACQHGREQRRGCHTESEPASRSRAATRRARSNQALPSGGRSSPASTANHVKAIFPILLDPPTRAGKGWCNRPDGGIPAVKAPPRFASSTPAILGACIHWQLLP